MKSIVQEGSTIAKAVDLGWREAGQPEEFSVKILELPEHNFLGLTTRSAKVAILFNGAKPRDKKPSHGKNASQNRRNQQKSTSSKPIERAERQERHPKKERPQRQPEKPAAKQQARPAKVRPLTPKTDNKPAPKQADPAPVKDTTPTTDKPARKKPAGMWSEELVGSAQNWFTKVLKEMKRNDVTFTIEPQNFYLRITLSKPIIGDEAKEKHLLASLSSLMLATVKKQFRKALRGHKIVLTHAE